MPWGYAAAAVGTYLGSRNAGNAAGDAARLQADAGDAATEEARRQFDITQGNIQPQIEAGNLARDQQMALLGLLGPEAQAAAQQSLAESPGQQFMRERQQRALVRNSAAIGGLGGGNVRTELQQQAAGFAAQDYGNQFNRLAGLSGSGQTATGMLGQFGQQTSANIQQNLMYSGEARAAGVFGQAQARSNLYSGLSNIAGSYFSDDQLKTNIKKIGSIGKLDLFSWIWKSSGKKDIGLIAQQVQKVFPHLTINNNGFLMVNYDQAIKAA